MAMGWKILPIALLGACVLLAGTILGLCQIAGIPLAGLPRAPQVGAGLAAKIACSGHYISAFSEQQMQADIRIFSPALQLAELDFSTRGQVTASLLGVTASARYYPGLGCILQMPGIYPLEALSFPQPPVTANTLATAPSLRDRRLQSAVDAMLARDNQQGLNTRALLVVRGRRVLAESYAEGMAADTAFLGWSMGKSLTALVAGRLEAMGVLSARESQLFPAWLQDERADISVEHLLQMASGLRFSEPYVPGNDSTRMLFNAFSASDVALHKSLAFPPGSHFAYSSGTTNLLCRLFSDRLGSPQAFINFFVREVAAPLGLRNTVMELDPSGRCVGSSYVYASARDWARMGLPLLNAGRSGQRQWLSQDWVVRAVSPNSTQNEPRYGYQLWLNRGGAAARWPDLPQDAFAMLGHNGQAVMVLPSQDSVIVRLGWSRGDYPVNQRFAALLAYLR